MSSPHRGTYEGEYSEEEFSFDDLDQHGSFFPGEESMEDSGSEEEHADDSGSVDSQNIDETIEIIYEIISSARLPDREELNIEIRYESEIDSVIVELNHRGGLLDTLNLSSHFNYLLERSEVLIPGDLVYVDSISNPEHFAHFTINESGTLVRTEREEIPEEVSSHLESMSHVRRVLSQFHEYSLDEDFPNLQIWYDSSVNAIFIQLNSGNGFAQTMDFSSDFNRILERNGIQVPMDLVYYDDVFSHNEYIHFTQRDGSFIRTSQDDNPSTITDYLRDGAILEANQLLTEIYNSINELMSPGMTFRYESEINSVIFELHHGGDSDLTTQFAEYCNYYIAASGVSLPMGIIYIDNAINAEHFIRFVQDEIGNFVRTESEVAPEEIIRFIQSMTNQALIEGGIELMDEDDGEIEEEVAPHAEEEEEEEEEEEAQDAAMPLAPFTPQRPIHEHAADSSTGMRSAPISSGPSIHSQQLRAVPVDESHYHTESLMERTLRVAEETPTLTRSERGLAQLAPRALDFGQENTDDESGSITTSANSTSVDAQSASAEDAAEVPAPAPEGETHLVASSERGLAQLAPRALDFDQEDTDDESSSSDSGITGRDSDSSIHSRRDSSGSVEDFETSEITFERDATIIPASANATRVAAQSASAEELAACDAAEVPAPAPAGGIPLVASISVTALAGTGSRVEHPHDSECL